jgi:hypothetical protein
MAKCFLLILISELLFSSCSMFDQNDFIVTEYIGQIDNEKFLYSAYQTGIDNYRIEFKVVVNKDTAKIFDYWINDALYTKEHSFHFKTSQDTLIISTPFNSCKAYYKTKKGTTIELTNKSNTKPCVD